MVELRRRRLQELADGVGREAGVLACDRHRDLVEGRGTGGDLGALAELVAAGGREVTDEHIRRLLEICNRVVNALGVEPMDPAQNRRAARFLLHHDYDL